MIIYFSGTGNSRFVAEKLAESINDEVCDVAGFIRRGETGNFTKSGNYIFVSPVYAAAPPRVFMDFIRSSTFSGNVDAYFVMTCAGGMGPSPCYCLRIAEEKGFNYMGTAEVCMPQNYIAYFKTKEQEENLEVIRKALPVIDRLVSLILNHNRLPDPLMKRWEVISTRLILDLFYRFFVKSKAFRTTKACNGCGHCAAVCPLGNIELSNGSPIWKDNCTHCMACINFCPKDAIEYGKKTIGKPRYKGPR